MESNILDQPVQHKFLCKKSSEVDVQNQSLKVFHPDTFKSLPASVDLSNKFPIYDQGALGSCASNASSLAYKYAYPLINPSRLFLYFNARTRSNPSNQYIDCGSSITDVMIILKQIGICNEILWPYDITKFAIEPSQNCYQDALNNKIINPIALAPDINNIKSVLATGKPVVYGMSVYDSIYSLTKDNPVYTGQGNLLGAHALTIVGYNDTTQLFKIQNSWSSNWCDGGCFFIPYSIITNNNICWDFWAILDN